MKTGLNQFIGKRDTDLEKAFGFSHYLELKDKLTLGRDQDHKSLVEAVFRFIEDDDAIAVVKLNDDVVKGFLEMGLDEIKANLLLLERDEGLFYDDDSRISYAFLGKDFFAYLFPNLLMFSADKGNSDRMAKILDESSLSYSGPRELENEDYV